MIYFQKWHQHLIQGILRYPEMVYYWTKQILALVSDNDLDQLSIFASLEHFLP